MRAKQVKIVAFLILCVANAATITSARAAIIGADGGITLYISYDNVDLAGGASWNDNVTQTNSVVGGLGCTATNNARTAQGAPDSPGSCTSGTTCPGKEKLTGDIEKLAEYIYVSTDGQHYLRRVYVSDNGRAWANADVRWSVGGGGSTSAGVADAWATPGVAFTMRSGARRCIHDVAHHELGHYFYNLPDRYARIADGYYTGTIGGGAEFDVAVDVGDPNTVMAGNFPHRFVDTTNAQITISYNPGSGLISGQVLTPALLADADPGNDGPDRAHHFFTEPFAQDEWSMLPTHHADLVAAHTEGDFIVPELGSMPAVDIRFLGEDEPHPGAILLLDRSGSMGVLTNGIPASRFVQEAGMYLYHSSLDGDYVGTQLYNATVETLFDYEAYDPTNQLPFANFRNASGLTNIAAALESAIDALIAQHGDDGVNGAQIVLMSDGKQTTGASLWDQVTRAVDKGILIHTLSFGNADTATMDAIATSTSGDNIEMSENTDGTELKLGMNRELSELRGLTPVHFLKGYLKSNGQGKGYEYYEGSFELPPNNRALQFYVFQEPGDASLFELELEDNAGTIYKANPQNVAQKGRLNGITVPKPRQGSWRYRIKGTKRTDGSLLISNPYEIIAHVLNNDLDTELRVVDAGSKFPGQFRIEAKMMHRYPLTGVIATAHIYRGNQKLGSIVLKDNGKPSIDTQRLDGVYSGLIDPNKFGISSKRPKVRIDVDFKTTSKSRPAPYAHYETGANVKELDEDYTKQAKWEFTAFATDTVSFNNKDEYQPRIVSIEPERTQKVWPGYRGKLNVVIENAFISRQSLRVSLGNGVQTEITGIEADKGSFRSTVHIAYQVGKDANKGTRDLEVHSNNVRLQQPGVLYVSH